jgi:hypothetical protein
MNNVSTARGIDPVFSMLATVVPLLLIGAACNASEFNPKCKQNVPNPSRCFFVDGTVMPSADVGLVLGTTDEHTLVIRSALPTEPGIPDDLEQVFASYPLRATVSGHFEVCPIPDQKTQFAPGFLKFVCINYAKVTAITP